MRILESRWKIIGIFEVLGPRLGFLEPVVVTHYGLQELKGSLCYSCSQKIRKEFQDWWIVQARLPAEQSRVQRPCQTMQHFTSAIQVKQGCQHLLLLWLLPARGKEGWIASCLTQQLIPSQVQL